MMSTCGYKMITEKAFTFTLLITYIIIIKKFFWYSGIQFIINKTCYIPLATYQLKKEETCKLISYVESASAKLMHCHVVIVGSYHSELTHHLVAIVGSYQSEVDAPPGGCSGRL